jgi:hypothetical protein
MKAEAATKPATKKRSKLPAVIEVEGGKEKEVADEPTVIEPEGLGTKKSIKLEPNEIRMTRIKQWYFPADVESYKILRSMGVPLLKINQTFLPTLRLITKARGISGKEIMFNEELLDPFLNMLATTWKKKYGKCLISSSEMTFIASDPEKLQAAKDAIQKLEALIHTFFSRWGFAYIPQYSESASGKRIKFHVSYKFDDKKMPIINLEAEEMVLPKVHLKLGFVRLTLSFDNPKGKIVYGKSAPGAERPPKYIEPGFVHVTYEISKGGKWEPYHSSKCNITQLSNVLPFVMALMNVPNLDPFNEENSAE